VNKLSSVLFKKIDGGVNSRAE